MDVTLRVRRGGEGGPTLLLLHGMGATSEAWNGVISRLEQHWDGSWAVPDLPGHGDSDPVEHYSFGTMAAAVAQSVRGAERLVVLGHSLGGVVGLALASGWFGVRVDAVCGLGIKASWSDEELAGATAAARRPARSFENRAQAAERYLKVSGLLGLVEADSSEVEGGLVLADGGWRLAMDQRAFGIGAPDLPGLLAAARARVTLAAGEHDPMSSAADLRALVPDPVILPGLGHNAQVEDPDAILALIRSL
ncbi:alpha/beta hydrolase [Allokutzneria sp. A3M-2-11 16]|uniref:alpha/beta fold hydrolase n=1 Tax=Allokutzneria sp. A3M-2-11 16 TaxID=2962043 RepID=UPI0020B7F2C8|nr:alpha/beta hydrolase [Allokutzneria sp. A3M-2-11 16]MCP3800945.1 alpha/beta hydrolase [Allokutzneria sp. A3M-2-11 16]